MMTQLKMERVSLAKALRAVLEKSLGKSGLVKTIMIMMSLNKMKKDHVIWYLQ